MKNIYSRSTNFRNTLLSSSRFNALSFIFGSALFAPAAFAQDQDEAPAYSSVADDPEALPAEGDITVTGTRIARDGYDAPTPVTVISTKELTAEAPANISNFVTTLPSVIATGNGGTLSNASMGVNTVNLRGLGPERTLVLVDGQRSVSSTNTGSIDLNTIPQSLIERVEVVTGGASSAYGSDAISGVINFILDKDYTGIKASYEYGETTYGDGSNHKISVTAGQPFADGRGHIILSGEYVEQNPIHRTNRDWNNGGFFTVNNPQYSGAACADSSTATVCYPEYLVTKGAGASSFTPGGLITFGPLRGTYFGSIDPATGTATVNQLNFGALQSGSQWMVGGDTDITSAAHRNSASFLPSEDRVSAFGRLSYEFSPAINVFAQFSYARYRGEQIYQQTATTATSATTGYLIQRDNAFLPDEIRQAMIDNGLTSIRAGVGNVFIDPQGADNTREVYRFVAGANGQFGLFDSEWTWDGYYQRGITKTNELLTNAWHLGRYSLATDAVFAPAGNAAGIAPGTIVCRSTLTDPTNGCVPLNLIGVDTNQEAAVDYITFGGQNPLRNQRLTQDVGAISFSTNSLFELPADGVGLAFGAEWRKEYINGTVDPLFQPTKDVDGNLVASWLYGNFLENTGSYTVKEAFVEALIPIITGLDFNGAVRFTDYSTSGFAATWKAGLTWQVINDIKLRGTVSRDIRAPNLADLFAPGGGRSNSVSRPLTGGGTVTDRLIVSNLGNAALKPEVARTYGAGVVVTPGFLPGFAASLDYYHIKLSDAISVYDAQVIADQCYLQNVAGSCNYIVTTAGRGQIGNNADITSIDIVPQNFVSIKTSGLDFEASYRQQVGPGDLTLRALATYVFELTSDNGLIAATDAAGANTGSVPDFRYRVSAAYDFDSGFSLQLVARGLSSGVYNNNYVVCETDCPVSTPDFRTINTNHIPGATYVDLNASYTFTVANVEAQVFGVIRNVLNTDPVLIALGPTGDQTGSYPTTNRNIYDSLGRVFRVGFRLSL